MPQADDAARLPCLTTGAPAPATTRAAIVEMFTEWERSPPVPTMSTAGPGTSIRWAAASIAAARPDISAAVSPLLRSATAKAAIWAGVASPAMTSPIAHWAAPASRSSRRSSVLSTVGQVGVPVVIGRSGAGGDVAGRHPRPQQLGGRGGGGDGVERVRDHAVGT